MRRLLRIIVDALFPQTIHGTLLASVTPEQFSRHYSPLPVHGIITLSRYQTPVIQAAVAACKFENNIRAAKLLAALPNQWITERPVPGTTILVPIPLSRERQKERGFNQVERVLTGMPKHTSLLIKRNWLIRTINTDRQTSLDRTKRLRNMSGAFAPNPSLANVAWSNISRVIICDDVLTTGATLTAAKAALLPHIPEHVSVVCLTWAH